MAFFCIYAKTFTVNIIWASLEASPASMFGGRPTPACLLCKSISLQCTAHVSQHSRRYLQNQLKIKKEPETEFRPTNNKIL